jgi:hypothetical protein
MSSLCNHNKKFHNKSTKVKIGKVKCKETTTKSNANIPILQNEPIIKTFDCRICNDKKYKHKQTRWAHEKICKVVFENNKVMSEKDVLKKVLKEKFVEKGTDKFLDWCIDFFLDNKKIL